MIIYNEKYTDFLVMANNWFKAQNKALYDIAETKLGGIGDKSALRFDLSGLKDVVRTLKEDNSLMAQYFGSFKSPIFTLIDEQPSLTLGQLQQFKQAAQLAAFDVSANPMAPLADQVFIRQILAKTQNVLDNEYRRLAKLRSTGESIDAVPTPIVRRINAEGVAGSGIDRIITTKIVKFKY